jgi:hypothetical protein
MTGATAERLKQTGEKRASIKKNKEMLDRFEDSERLLQQWPEGEETKNLPLSFFSLHGCLSGGDTFGSFAVPKMLYTFC